MILLVVLTVALGAFVFTIGFAIANSLGWQPNADKHDIPPVAMFTCWNCNSGPWDRAWDSIEGGMTSYSRASKGFGLCPNCSGAD